MEREKLLNCANKLFFFFLKFLAISFFFSLSSLLFLLSHITVKSPPRCFQELALAHLCPLPPPSCTQVAPTNSSLRACVSNLASVFCSVYGRRRWLLAGACEVGSVVRGVPKGLICSTNNWQRGCRISESWFGSCCVLPHLAASLLDILFLNTKHCAPQELHTEHRGNGGGRKAAGKGQNKGISSEPFTRDHVSSHTLHYS